jgi:hypothetical protein
MPTDEPVWKTLPPKDFVILRSGVTLAFFLPMPFGEVATAALETFERYLAGIPQGVLRWSAVGATTDEWKPLAKTTLGRCRALLTGDGPATRNLTAFTLTDGQEGGAAPGYSILVVGGKPSPRLLDELALIQMTFPSSVLAEDGIEKFVTFATHLAEPLPYVSGYGSPALVWSESDPTAGLRAAWGQAVRHAGYDVESNETGRLRLGVRVRGARWLTFLGPELLAKLGGLDAMKANLPVTVTLEPAGHGTLMRAGAVAEIGDRNRREETPLLRAVARVLEPVTQFEESMLLRSPFAAGHESEFLEWERRFLK